MQDKGGVTQLLDELKAIASTRKMRFIDSSERVKGNLLVINYANKERADGSPFIYVGVQREDGMGVDAGNLGLPGYQVALGFSEGADPLDARRFADEVIERLEQHWRVEIIPNGQGAKPMSSCGVQR